MAEDSYFFHIPLWLLPENSSYIQNIMSAYIELYFSILWQESQLFQPKRNFACGTFTVKLKWAPEIYIKTAFKRFTDLYRKISKKYLKCDF